MLPITDEITVLSLLHPCTPCTLVEINEVKCIRQGAHKSNRISSSLCSHNIGLSLKYIYTNMSVKCYLCTYVVYHITCMLGDNKDIVNWKLNWISSLPYIHLSDWLILPLLNTTTWDLEELTFSFHRSQYQYSELISDCSSSTESAKITMSSAYNKRNIFTWETVIPELLVLRYISRSLIYMDGE